MPYFAVADSGCLFAVQYSRTTVESIAFVGEITIYKRCSTRAFFSDGVVQTLTENPNRDFGIGLAIDGQGTTLATSSRTENLYVYNSVKVNC